MRGERVDERLTTLRIEIRGARESSAARRIRPQRERQPLQQVAHPAYAQRLASLDARNRRRVAGDNGDAQIGTEELRRGLHRHPVLGRRIGQRHHRRARHRTDGIDLDQRPRASGDGAGVRDRRRGARSSPRRSDSAHAM